MIESAIKRGIIVTVSLLIISILGVVAALNIPVQMIPDLEVRTVTVSTGWPGATPQDIEKEILIEQERYLRSLPNLKRMISSAELGSARIELEFPFGVDVNEALIRVSNALSQVPSYPENVDQPRLFSSSFSSNAFMFFRLAPLDGNPMRLDVDMLRDFADDVIRPRMESVQGVSQVDVRGGAARQIQIKVDAAKLAQRGLTLTQVRDAIRSRNTDASAGDLESGAQRYLLRVVGRFEQLSELENLILSQSENAVTYLKDVASVLLDHYESRGVSFSDGERNLTLSVRREAGSNVIQIKKDLLPVVTELNESLLRQNGLSLKLFSDDVQYVESSLKNVWVNLGLGAALATLVMFYFLRSARSTLIGVLGIPLCTIAGFIALLAFGRTINVISLAGIAFAIGMTVDNTIVVLESINQNRKRHNHSLMKAALEGVTEVWPAVLASTTTTVLVFAPILFIEQEAGQLYSDIAIAISGAIIASMLVAIFVVPVAMAHLTSRSDKVQSVSQESTETNLPEGSKLSVSSSGKTPALVQDAPVLSKQWLKLVAFFTSSTQFARFAVLGFALTILGGAYLFMPAAEYLPEGEEPKAFSIMIAPPDYNLSEMERIGAELRAYFNDYLNADPAEFESGRTNMPPLAYYNMSVSVGSIWFLSAPVEPQLINEMMEAITQKFRSYDGMRAFSSRGSIISSNDGGTRAVAIDIAGNQILDLYSAADAIYQEAQKTFDNPQINSDPGSLTLDQPLIEIRPRWQRLAELGFNNRDFGYSVAAVSDGAFVDEFILDDDKVDIFLFSASGNQQRIEDLASTPILTPRGQVLPLNALADLRESKDSNSIRRVDGNRTVTVYIIPPREVALETAEQKVRTEMIPSLYQQGAIAQGITLNISGAADQLEATKAALSSNFLIAIILCYLLLVAIFSNWHYPLFILATVPMGMAGGLLGLILVNVLGQGLNSLGLNGIQQPFDMITMLGFLILLGTVVNNPILIVDQTRKFIERGQEKRDAIQAAVKRRLKPILMSSATTIFGLAPLVFMPGEGTELYRGVGIIVLCGIFVSTLLSFTFLPALLMALLPTSSYTRSKNITK